MQDLENRIDKYADVLINKGCAIKPGKRLIIKAPIEAVDFVRVLVKKAYQAQAKFVSVQWLDDLTGKLRYQYAPDDSFDYYPDWIKYPNEDIAENHDCLLALSGNDPELLSDQDPQKIQAVQRAVNVHMKKFREMMMKNYCSWCIGAYPVQAWAAKVFPDDKPEEQKSKLWEAILKTSRIDNNNPIQTWQDHVVELKKRADYMNTKQYTALHYKAPGTDLTVGLPKGHIWCSAEDEAKDGNVYIANIPSEEIFTLPDYSRVDGVVKSTKALNYGGTVCENFEFIFKDGKAISVKAEKGQVALENLLSLDDWSSYLGEVALVPHSSPISASGIMFYNTLFDENASCHLALGAAYNFTLQGGNDMNEEEFRKAGGNKSIAHTDFMIGSGELDIDGILEDGTSEPVMCSGEWAF